jgi:hypothetical protein
MSKNTTIVLIPLSQTFRSYLRNQYGPSMYSKFRKFERVKIQLARTSNYVTFLMKVKVHDVVPKGLTLKAPYHSHLSSKKTLRASKALLRGRILFKRSGDRD